MDHFEAAATTHLRVVSDPTASKDWYVRALDASVHNEHGTSVVQEIAGSWILLVMGGNPRRTDRP